MSLVFVILGGILLGACAFFVRVKPIWGSRYRGCDAYYYLLCTEELRKKRRLPIILPDYFLLDIQEQWYPPGFSVFLSLFPKRFIEKYYWVGSPAVDSLIAVCLYMITYLLTANFVAAAGAGFLYALTPAAITELFSLNSRPLGSLLLAATVLSTFVFVNYHSLYALGACLVFGFCLLMTHKMSAQLLYFVLPLMSLVFWDYMYILAMISIICATFLLSRGFFIKILRSQYDILSFWNRNWKNLGAHQVYSSPVYGDENREDPGRIFQKGPRGIYRQIRHLGLNVFAVLLVFPLLHYNQLTLFDSQMLWLVILTYALVVLTLLVPQLRFYGEGYKYMRMAAFPVAYLAMSPVYYEWDVGYYFYAVISIATILSIVVLLRIYRFESSISWGNTSMDSDLSGVTGFLKDNDKVRVIISVPVYLMDTIVYHCRKKVVWGTHSDNFRVVEPFYPVYRRSLENFVSTYKVSHIVINTSYVSPETLRLPPTGRVFSAGLYQIYEL